MSSQPPDRWSRAQIVWGLIRSKPFDLRSMHQIGFPQRGTQFNLRHWNPDQRSLCLLPPPARNGGGRVPSGGAIAEPPQNSNPVHESLIPMSLLEVRNMAKQWGTSLLEIIVGKSPATAVSSSGASAKDSGRLKHGFAQARPQTTHAQHGEAPSPRFEARTVTQTRSRGGVHFLSPSVRGGLDGGPTHSPLDGSEGGRACLCTRGTPVKVGCRGEVVGGRTRASRRRPTTSPVREERVQVCCAAPRKRWQHGPTIRWPSGTCAWWLVSALVWS
jgi:hypothetical protein